MPSQARTDEFDGECVMGLTLGKDIKTDCSVNTTFNGKTYCFGNETAKAVFLKRPEEFYQGAGVLLKQEPIAACAMNALAALPRGDPLKALQKSPSPGRGRSASFRPSVFIHLPPPHALPRS